MKWDYDTILYIWFGVCKNSYNFCFKFKILYFLLHKYQNCNEKMQSVLWTRKQILNSAILKWKSQGVGTPAHCKHIKVLHFVDLKCNCPSCHLFTPKVVLYPNVLCPCPWIHWILGKRYGTLVVTHDQSRCLHIILAPHIIQELPQPYIIWLLLCNGWPPCIPPLLWTRPPRGLPLATPWHHSIPKAECIARGGSPIIYITSPIRITMPPSTSCVAPLQVATSSISWCHPMTPPPGVAMCWPTVLTAKAKSALCGHHGIHQWSHRWLV
jgi:hypothetical protein